MKSSKTQLHKIEQSGRSLGRPLGVLLKSGLSLIGNVIKPLAKSVLIPLGLTAATSVTDTAIHKKTFGSGTRLLDLAKQSTLIISNEEMNDIMKIDKSKEQKGGFVRMLWGTSGASLLGNLLTGKGTIKAGEGQLEQARIFNVVSSFNKVWNTKVLSK